MTVAHELTPQAAAHARPLWYPAAGLRARAAALDWSSLAAFGLPLLLYLRTLAPTVYNLDSAELTTAAATGGILRATGYPLYLVIGRLWSQLPIGDVGYRINLLSAVAGALTVLLAERCLRRLEVGPWARLGALGLLAVSPYFWALSLIAEVYTLHTALMAGLILLLLRWREAPSARRLAAATFLAALSLGHHGATALLLPGCLWAALTVAPRRALAPRTLALGALALLAGLSVFLYLPLAYAARPAYNYAGWYTAAGSFVPMNLQTAQGVWWLVSGSSFARQMFAYAPPELWHETLAFGEQLWAAFLAVGIGPGLLGLALLLRRDWRVAGMLVLMFVLNAAFYINYRVDDKATMFLPTYLIWALWLGVGFQQLLDWLAGAARAAARGAEPAAARAAARPAPRGLLVVARMALAASVLAGLVLTWPRVDLSGDWTARQRGEMLLRALEPNALVFGDWDTIALIQYLQLVEGQRPDVLPISRFLISAENTRRLILSEIDHRPIYMNYAPARLRRLVTTDEPVGPLYRLELRQPQAGPGGGP
jgi:hypothetical protein